MGGQGSGNWLGSGRKTSVMECFRLTVKDLHESGIIPGEADEVLFWWQPPDEKQDLPKVRVRAHVTSRTAREITVSLQYAVTVGKEPRDVEEPVRVIKAAPANGGKWWFQCPAQVDGEPCLRRAGVLYLPVDEEYFACRICHELSYPDKSQTTPNDNNQQGEEGDAGIEDEPSEAWDEPWKPDRDVTSPGGQPVAASPPQPPVSLHVAQAMKSLRSRSRRLGKAGRARLINELLAKMIRDGELSDEQFSQGASEIQSLAPTAFAAFATRALREGAYAVGSRSVQDFFPIHRLGRILRLHLAADMQIERSGDLLILDAAIDAYCQARILLSRATPWSQDFGPLPNEEKLYRSQAVSQQKIFLALMSKLQAKYSQTPGKSPTKDSA